MSLRSIRLPRLRLLVALAALLGILAGGWLWLRDSWLVRVRDVRITGITASDGPRVRAALEAAARDTSTLHVDRRALEEAVAPFASVARLRIDADFPHGLAVEVIERRPVAALAVGGDRLPVTGAGLVLRDVQADRDLPDIVRSSAPAGDRIGDRRTRAALAVAAAAPQPLLHRTQRLTWSPRGLTLNLRHGPPLIFGDAAQADAKWVAAARVLAEPSAEGATYLDLRIPGRVAAGGLGPVVEEDAEGDAQAEAQAQGENGPTLNP